MLAFARDVVSGDNFIDEQGIAAAGLEIQKGGDIVFEFNDFTERFFKIGFGFESFSGAGLGLQGELLAGEVCQGLDR